MPCSVPSTSVLKARRLPSLPLRPRKIVAALNLTDSVEREVRAIIERFHSGPHPLFKAHAMRQVGRVIYELAQWHPRRRSGPLSFSVVEWSLTQIALCWRDCPTFDAAQEAFQAAVSSAGPAAALAAAQQSAGGAA